MKVYQVRSWNSNHSVYGGGWQIAAIYATEALAEQAAELMRKRGHSMVQVHPFEVLNELAIELRDRVGA